jgi:hypothetical protein
MRGPYRAVRAHNGMRLLRGLQLFPEATSVGAASRPITTSSPRSVESASRRFETSLKRLKCAKSRHCQPARLMGHTKFLLALVPRQASRLRARSVRSRQRLNIVIITGVLLRRLPSRFIRIATRESPYDRDLVPPRTARYSSEYFPRGSCGHASTLKSPSGATSASAR